MGILKEDYKNNVELLRYYNDIKHIWRLSRQPLGNGNNAACKHYRLEVQINKKV